MLQKAFQSQTFGRLSQNGMMPALTRTLSELPSFQLVAGGRSTFVGKVDEGEPGGNV